MPLYEYECRFCGHTEEKRRAIADADKVIACPKCTRAMKRVTANKLAHFKIEGGR